MSWGLYSNRIFCISSNSTPAKIGPGKYDTVDYIGNNKQMKAPFNSGDKEPKNPFAKTPGPGQYEPKILEKGNDYASVFDSKTKRKAYTTTNNQNPSPTSYSCIDSWMPEPPAIPKKQLPRAKPPSGFIGQDVTGYIESPSNELIPLKKPFLDASYIGPGYYDPELPTRETPGVNLEMSSKRQLYGTPPDVPGPGAYKPTFHDSRIPKVISDRKEDKVVLTNRPIYTGPRSWTSLANETNAVFKYRGVRQIFPPGEATPGPSEYEINLPQTKVAGNLSSFGVRAQRQPLHSPDDNPGPGAYNVNAPKWIKKTKKSTARHAIDKITNPTSFVPGPGAYDPFSAQDQKKQKRANSVFMSKTDRNLTSRNITPGPGRYTPKKPGEVQPKQDLKSQKLRFTDVKKQINTPDIKESRFPKFGNWIEASKIISPSPDQYQSIESDAGSGKTIPHSPRFERSHKSRDPGPGAYEVVHDSFFKKSFNTSIPKYY